MIPIRRLSGPSTRLDGDFEMAMKERSSLPFFEKKLSRAGPAPPNKQLLLARKAFSLRAALAVSMLGRAAELQVR